MPEIYYTAAFLAAVFVPVAVFSLIALASQSRHQVGPEQATEEYLLSSRAATTGDVINSSAAYMLQVSTTFYFVYWGYHYGLSNIFYLLSWGFGIFIFSLFAPKLLLIRNTVETVSRYLAPTSGVVRITCALAAISAFLGVFYVETFFTTDFMTALLPKRADVDVGMLWWVIFALLAAVTVVYSVFGGLRKVISTDNVQLAFAYLGLSFVFSFLFYPAANISSITALFCGATILIMYGFFLYHDIKFADGWVKRILLIVAIVTLSYSLWDALSDARANIAGPFVVEGVFKQIVEPWGWVTLLGFTILNLLWQFCDSSNFQRIAALELSGTKPEQEAALRRALRGLIWISPLTWGLGIFLGILVKAAGVQASAGISEYAALLSFMREAALSNAGLPLLAVLGLATAMTSIMMSTADSSIVAFVQAYARDIRPRTSMSARTTISIAVLTLGFALAFAYIQREQSGTNIMIVMAGVYSALAVLSVPCLLRMLDIETPAWTIFLSVALGTAATWYATFGAFPGIHGNVKLVLPFFAAIGVSGLIQLVVGVPFAMMNRARSA